MKLARVGTLAGFCSLLLAAAPACAGAMASSVGSMMMAPAARQPRVTQDRVPMPPSSSPITL